MKTAVPIAIHKAIAPLLPTLKNGNYLIDRKADIFRIKAADPASDFFFEINSFEQRDGKTLVTSKQKPASEINISEVETTNWISAFEKLFGTWITLMEQYKNTPTVFDDPIIEKYAEEFFTEFQGLDEDGDKISFSYPKQLLIEKGLSDIVEVLESKRDETNDEKVSPLIEEAEEIKEALTDMTQVETATRVSGLLAKIRKAGMKFIKGTYPIFQKEIVSSIVKGLVESASHIPDHLPNIIDIVT